MRGVTQRAGRRRVRAAFVAVALIASSAVLSHGAVLAQESQQSPTAESPSAASDAAASQTSSGGWRDGTATLAAARPPAGAFVPSYNRLSGSVPEELGDLTNLTVLDLGGNGLSGCVSAPLAVVRSIWFVLGLSYCRAPVLLAVVLVGGSVVELAYGADLDESSVPSDSAFEVDVDGSDRAITTVTVAGRVVRLALASPVSSTEQALVSYKVPAESDAARIAGTGGDDAAGFVDEAVVRPPDPPTLTGVESTDSGLTVSWEAVAGVSGYDVGWREHERRQDGESAWQSTRMGIRQQHTIADLTEAAVYWVRVRAVKTHGGLEGQTLYVTAWSTPEPGVAGNFTPKNLEITPGDRSLTVTWDLVPGATGYEVEYRRAPDGPWISYVHGPETLAALIAAPPVTLTGLDNGVTYEVNVRSVFVIASEPDEVTPRGWIPPGSGILR